MCNSLVFATKTENYINKAKKILAIFFACLLVFSFINGISALAADDKETSNGISVTEDNEGYIVYTINNKSYSSKDAKSMWFRLAAFLVFNVYGGQSSLLTQSNIFKTNVTGTETSGIWGLFWAAYDQVAVIGIGLALIWTLLSLIETASSGHVTPEFMIRMAVQFCFCCLICNQGKNFAASLIGLGDNLFDTISNGAADYLTGGGGDSLSKTASGIFDDIHNGNMFMCLSYISEMLIPGLAILICYFYALILLIGRIFELGIRTVFFPIGVADFATHGPSSPGMRYAKQYLGCVCRGAAMYLVVIIGLNLMNTTSLADLLGQGSLGAFIAVKAFLPILQILVMVTIIGAMKKTDSILRDVFA
jgi:hypothetical protein